MTFNQKLSKGIIYTTTLDGMTIPEETTTMVRLVLRQWGWYHG